MKLLFGKYFDALHLYGLAALADERATAMAGVAKTRRDWLGMIAA